MSLPTNFPLYCVASSDALGGVVIAGGGGGTSKVGIPNAITVMTWDEKAHSLTPALTYDEIDDVVLNIALQAPSTDRLHVAFGHGNSCTLLVLAKEKPKKKKKEKKDEQEDEAKITILGKKTAEVIERPKRADSDDDDDDDDDDPEQTAVAFMSGTRSTEYGVACGLSTGAIKIFDTNFKLAQEIPAEKDCGAVNSLDCNEDCILATFADGKVRKWRRKANSLKVDEECELVAGPQDQGFSVPVKPPPRPKFGSSSGAKPLFKCVRFVPQDNKSEPGEKPKPNAKELKDCFVVAGMLSSSSWVAGATPEEKKGAAVAVSTKTSRHTSLAVSENHIALATNDGEVIVHENKLPGSVKRLCVLKKVHNFVATGVAFTPCGASHVVSVGLDNRVCVSEIKKPRFHAFSLLLFIITLLVICVAVFYRHALIEYANN